MSFRVIKPTKTNLIDLQKRYNFVLKGERFLEFKREQLIAQIKESWGEYQKRRERFIDLYKRSIIRLNQSYKEMGKRDLILISEMSQFQYNPIAVIKYIKSVGLTIPKFNINLGADNKLPAYGFENSSPYLDSLMIILREFFFSIIEFAEQEDLLIKFGLNFKKVNRRINGLNNKIIPDLESQIKLIQEKLEEMERESFVRLKKTKELIKKEETVKVNNYSS